jgi:beta-lactamase class A
MEDTRPHRMLVNRSLVELGAPNPRRKAVPLTRRILIGGAFAFAPTFQAVASPNGQGDETSGPMAWAPPQTDPFLQATIETVPRPVGSVSVAVHHLATGHGAGINADTIAPPASLFKLGVMVAVMRAIEAGRLAPETSFDIREEDWAPGAGLLQDRVGETVTVGEALRLMMGISDNVAAFVLLRAVSVARLNAVTASLGMGRTRFFVGERSDETSAGDVAVILARIATGEAAGPDSTRTMLDLMGQRQAAAWIREALGSRVPIAHKSGQLPGVRNDAAIVPTNGGPYVVAILTHDLVNDGAGERYVGDVARAVDRYVAGER